MEAVVVFFLKLTKCVDHDFNILTIRQVASSGNVSAKTALNQDEQDGLKDALNRTDIPLTSIESVVDANGATVTSKGSVVGLRGLGLNFGIRF